MVIDNLHHFTRSAQIWSTIHQQLRVPDLPPDVSFMDWAPCPQQVPLVIMRPVVSTAQSMTSFNTSVKNISQFTDKKQRSNMNSAVSTYLEYLVDLRQVYFAPVFQLVDANFLAIKKEKTESHYLSSNEHTCLTLAYQPTLSFTCHQMNTPVSLLT